MPQTFGRQGRMLTQGVISQIWQRLCVGDRCKTNSADTDWLTIQGEGIKRQPTQSSRIQLRRPSLSLAWCTLTSQAWYDSTGCDLPWRHSRQWPQRWSCTCTLKKILLTRTQWLRALGLRWLAPIYKEIENFLLNTAISDADPALVVKLRSLGKGPLPERGFELGTCVVKVIGRPVHGPCTGAAFHYGGVPEHLLNGPFSDCWWIARSCCCEADGMAAGEQMSMGAGLGGGGGCAAPMRGCSSPMNPLGIPQPNVASSKGSACPWMASDSLVGMQGCPDLWSRTTSSIGLGGRWFCSHWAG